MKQPRRRRPTATALVLVLIGLIAAAVGTLVLARGSASPLLPPLASLAPWAQPPGPPVLVAAGDIATCGGEGDEATARLAAGIPGTVVTIGDNAYQKGSAEDYARCYAASWGALRQRTRPVPGNHEYRTRDARGYFDYFGSSAGPPGQGWYAYDLGDWRIYALNSNCGEIGGCGDGSPQLDWLRADLATNPRRCSAAYWHHPRFSSGRHGNDASVAPLWEALYTAGADVILSAHDHSYERFAPQDPAGRADPALGIRQFVVGTGGAGRYEFRAPRPNSELRHADSWGVLRLELRSDGYDWRFLPAGDGTFTDAGRGTCH